MGQRVQKLFFSTHIQEKYDNLTLKSVQGESELEILREYLEQNNIS